MMTQHPWQYGCQYASIDDCWYTEKRYRAWWVDAVFINSMLGKLAWSWYTPETNQSINNPTKQPTAKAAVARFSQRTPHPVPPHVCPGAGAMGSLDSTYYWVGSWAKLWKTVETMYPTISNHQFAHELTCSLIHRWESPMYLTVKSALISHQPR